VLALPVIAYTLWTGVRHRDRQYISERLGLTRPEPAKLIIHAASIGEVNAVVPLVELLLAQQPAISILLSVNTPSGRHTAHARLGDRVRYCYMPIDWRWSVYRYLRQVKPHCVWIMETELWPNFAEACYYHGILNIIVNARLSSRSTNAQRTIRGWQSKAVQYTYAVLARSEEDAERYLALGAHADRLRVMGNLKYASTHRAEVDAVNLGRDYVLLASSRDGEEKQIVQSWLSLAGAKPMLVIAPRHIRRSAEIIAALQSLTPAIAVRSRQDKVTESTAVYLADTFGELKGFIQGAHLVIMGGSFEAYGGQNIIEVAHAGKAVVFGPHMENFHDEAVALLAADAARQVADVDALGKTLDELLADPQQYATMGENGRQVVESYQHIGEDYLRALLQHCPQLTSNH